MVRGQHRERAVATSGNPFQVGGGKSNRRGGVAPGGLNENFIARYFGAGKSYRLYLLGVRDYKNIFAAHGFARPTVSHRQQASVAPDDIPKMLGFALAAQRPESLSRAARHYHNVSFHLFAVFYIVSPHSDSLSNFLKKYRRGLRKNLQNFFKAAITQ